MADRPKFENSPGLKVRPEGNKWEAFWRPRDDLIKKGCPMKSARLWVGTKPTDIERAWISDRCNALQSEMLTWGRGGIPMVGTFTGTIKSLVRCYETDPDSGVHKLRYTTRQTSTRFCKIIIEEHGDEFLTDIKARQILRWHEEWSKRGIAMGHDLMGKLRTIIRFGATFLEDDECERLAGVLGMMRFKLPPPRNMRLTAEHVIRIRRMAHAMGLHSVALAQVLQFEGMFRQKDVIGEWVPQTEPGVSDVTDGAWKWLRGLRWSEMNENGILKHVTSKRQKELVIDLRLAPMVMEEFAALSEIPKSGPMIVCETTGLPYRPTQWRTIWRKCADAAGVPKDVFNMDTRAGAISEATEAGSPIEHVKHAATHSDIAMTQRYSRGDTEKIAEVQKARAAHRNKKRTSTDENGS